MDKNGEFHTTSKSSSNPAYFGNILMTVHDTSNKNGMFLVKMATSSEDWPFYKTNKDRVTAG